MAFIIIPSRRIRRPAGQFTIDWSNPLASGLRVCCVPSLASANLANMRPLVGAQASLTGGPRGPYGNYVNYVDQGVRSFNLNAGYSVYLDFVTDSSPSGKGAVGLYAATYAFGFYPDNASTTYKGAFWEGGSFLSLGKPTGGALSASTAYRVAISRVAAAAGNRLFSNGLFTGTSDLSPSSISVVEASLGSTRGTSIEPSTTQKTLAFYVWARALTDAEHQAIDENPGQIFIPVHRRMYWSTAATGGETTGTWNSQLANITDSWSGLAVVSGTWSGNLDSITNTWTGQVAENVTGTFDSLLAAISDSWTGTVLTTGTWSSNLDAITGSWDGVVGDVVQGSWSSQLANITDAWSGTVSGSVGSWSSQLDSVTGSWNGIALVTGTWSSQLANVTGSWDGSLAINVDGSWSSQLEALTGSWTGAVSENATGTWNSQLAAITGSWNGSVTGSAVFPSANQVLVGIQYGPTGADYTGTLVSPTAAEIVAAITAAIIPVNVEQINTVPVIGTGTSGDLWRA